MTRTDPGHDEQPAASTSDLFEQRSGSSATMAAIPDHLARLRVLALLELEVDQFLAEQVAAARAAGQSWDAIAEAVGVARPTAWRRWNPGIEDPRPTRPQRRDAARLELTGKSLAAIGWVVQQLVGRVEGRRDTHPWSAATRTALQRLAFKYEVTSVDARETEYRVREHRAVITCLEPGSNSPGGLHLDVRPDRDQLLSGQASREARLTAADLPGQRLTPTPADVTSFLSSHLPPNRS